MFLVVCATEFEMQALADWITPKSDEWIGLVTGVGLVETTLHLSRFLEQHSTQSIQGVLNFGVAGAYLREDTNSAKLLDICLAEREVMGDFGICHPDRIESLAGNLSPQLSYTLSAEIVNRAESLLLENDFNSRAGNFVTVCGVSGTKDRGHMLCSKYDGLCENMEGAAVARVCDAFNLPMLEMRTISNFVEDRDLSRWKLAEACSKAGQVAAILLKYALKECAFFAPTLKGTRKGLSIE